MVSPAPVSAVPNEDVAPAASDAGLAAISRSRGLVECLIDLASSALGVPVAVFPPGIASGPIVSRGGWPEGPLEGEIRLLREAREQVGGGASLDAVEALGPLGSVPIEGEPGDRPGVLVVRIDRPLWDEDRDLMAEAAEAIGSAIRSGRESARLREEVDRSRVQVAAIDQASDEIRPVVEGHGGSSRRVAVPRDETQRREQEGRQQRMAAEARRLAMVVSRTSNAVVITDDLGQIEWVNEAFTRLCGYSQAEVIGRKPGALLQGAETDPETVSLMRQRIKACEGFQVELLNYTRSGESYWANLDVQPLRDETGRLVNFVGIVVDISERRRIETEVGELNTRLEQRLRRTAAHRRVDAAIALGRGLDQTIGVLLDQVMGELLPSASAVLTFTDGDERELTLLCSRGFQQPPKPGSRSRHEGSLDGYVVVEEPTRFGGDWVEPEGFRSSQSVMLSAKGRTLGALVCFQRGEFRADLDWLDLFEVLASQAAIAIDNALLVEELRQSNRELALAYDKTIEGWSRVMDLRDRETEGHSRRVAELAERLARRLGLPESRLIHLRRGALLHDIGKMGVPDAILLKPGSLDPQEWEQMKRHPELAEEMLRPIEFLRPALDIPVFHHEKWDGTGYPRGLKEDQIPFEARIFAAVDIYDALTSDRPYRAAWPVDRVRQHLRDLSGTHLDPAVVAEFDSMLEEADREAQ